MSPDDPELVNCTCIHRTLKDHEKIEFYLPNGRILTVAKDCPEHGMIRHESTQEASPNLA